GTAIPSHRCRENGGGFYILLLRRHDFHVWLVPKAVPAHPTTKPAISVLIIPPSPHGAGAGDASAFFWIVDSFIDVNIRCRRFFATNARRAACHRTPHLAGLLFRLVVRDHSPSPSPK